MPNRKVPRYTSRRNGCGSRRPSATRYEDLKTIMLPMAQNGAEPIRRDGQSILRWPFSATPHPPLFKYFKQMFAQVTNPPIDAIREEIVTSTTVYVGTRG